jgi:DNA-binding MarR family transcriptional regulator
MTSEERSDFFETYGLRILLALRRIIRAVDIHSRRLRTQHNVTAPQLICLYSLAKESPMTLSRLTAEVNLSISTVNGIVDRLEAKGLAVRKRSEVDRRKVEIALTSQGKELTKNAPSLLQDRFADALSHLPELEQAAIALSLERVVSLMEAEHLDASPNLLPNGQVQESGPKES